MADLDLQAEHRAQCQPPGNAWPWPPYQTWLEGKLREAVAALRSRDAEVGRLREACKEGMDACQAARSFGAQGETWEGVSVSYLLDEAIAKARAALERGEGKAGGG